MSDIYRGDEPGTVHHVFGHAIGGEVYYRDEEDCGMFREILADVIDKTDVVCLAYSLVVNHFHLILVSGRRWGLSRFMKRVLSRYARYFNKRHGRIGHLRRRPFGSEPIDSDEKLVTEIRYVLLNRVAAGLVPDLAALERDANTSYGIVMRGLPSRIVNGAAVLSIFGSTPEEALENLPRFCQAGIEKRDWRTEMTKILECAGRYRTEGIAIRTWAANYDSLEIELSRLTQIVCAAIPISPASLAGGRTSNRMVSKARAILAFLATRLLGAGRAMLAKQFEVSEQAVSTAAHRGASLAEQAGLGLDTVAKLLSAAHEAASAPNIRN